MSPAEADSETVTELSQAELGIPVRHRCVTATRLTGLVTHVVLPPQRPGSKPFTDLQDTGWTVKAVNPLDLPGCSCVEYGTHILLSRAES